MANALTTVTATYTTPAATGTLQVTLTPATVTNGGAQWQVDGGTLLNSGAVATVAAGTHTVTFTGIGFWKTPINQTVTVKAKATTKATAALIQFSKQGIYEIRVVFADGRGDGSDGGDVRAI